jgi:acylphosphatase
MTSSLAVRVRIEGRVQGVWFRSWTVEEAKARALTGWVRNRRDGSVEALFSGPETAVMEMLALCRQGPPAAQVTNVDETAAATPASDDFIQLPTE